METTVLITAFILIGLGVLVKRFPILIAGYNTMSKEEKMNVDVKGLSAFMCYSLVGMGTVPDLLTTSVWDWDMPIGQAIVFSFLYFIFRT